MYYFYFDKLLLPVAPSSLEMGIGNNNKQMVAINEGQINILRQAKLTEASFEVLLPNVKYPFAKYLNGYQPAVYYLKVFEELKMNKQPFQFIVSRKFPNGKILFDTNMKVSLEEYKIKEKDGFDILVSVKLRKYQDYAIKECKVTIQNYKPVATTTSNGRGGGTSASVQYYTVVAGDCLWNIAKKYYGNGSLYSKIWDVNRDKVSDPNLIYPGQVLTIPA